MDIQPIRDQYERPDFYDNGMSEYAIRPTLAEDFSKGYEAFVKITQCANGLSCVTDPSVMQTFDNKHHGTFVQFVKDDCKAKLKDVRDTNTAAKSISSFMSIMALIGFLSKCAFAHNEKVGKANQKICNSETTRFPAFVNRYFLAYDETAYLQADPSDGLAGFMYKVVRCGLLHGETLSHPDAKFSTSRIWLSHSRGGEKSLVDLDNEIRAGKMDIVLNAWTLCDAIDKAIDEMFDGVDVNVLDSITEVYRTEPPIIFLTDVDDSADGDVVKTEKHNL